MKQRQYAALAALPETERASAEELLRQWKQKTIVTALLALSVLTIAVLALWIVSHEDIQTCLACTFVFALLIEWVLLIVLEVQQRKFFRKLAEIPELSKPQNISQFPKQNPKTRFGWILTLIFITLLCPPLGILLLALGDSQKRKQLQAESQPIPADVLKLRAKEHSSRLGCCGFLLIGLAALGMLLREAVGFVGNSKLNVLNMQAKQLYNAANTALNDMDAEGMPFIPDSSTYIFRTGTDAEEGTLEWRMTQYFPDLQRTDAWYALQFDEDGSVTAAWYSHSPLQESDLVPTDFYEQKKLIVSWTHSDEAIGYDSETDTAE